MNTAVSGRGRASPRSLSHYLSGVMVLTLAVLCFMLSACGSTEHPVVSTMHGKDNVGRPVTFTVTTKGATADVAGSFDTSGVTTSKLDVRFFDSSNQPIGDTVTISGGSGTVDVPSNAASGLVAMYSSDGAGALVTLYVPH